MSNSISTKSQDKVRERSAFDAWGKEGTWLTFTSKTMERLSITFFEHIANPSKILELGCGTGENTWYLSRMSKGDVFACDLSEVCCRICKAKNPDAIVIVADAERLPFRNGTFDGLFLGSLVHHFPNPEVLLNECKRVLKTCGFLFAFDPNRRNPIVYFYRVIIGSKAMKTPNEVLYQRVELTEALQRAGFSEVIVDAMIPIYFTRDYYVKCLGRFLSYVFILCNLIERVFFLIPKVGKRIGSFLISRAKK